MAVDGPRRAPNSEFTHAPERNLAQKFFHVGVRSLDQIRLEFRIVEGGARADENDRLA
jgi:hypothetical protein